MGKKKQMEQEISAEPVRFDHLEAAPKSRKTKTKSKKTDFDSLEEFSSYIRDEAGDNEFDNLDVTLRYLPPFVMTETHGNEEKIKPGMNSLNKKFRRHLQQHVMRHLLPEISKMSGIDYDFKKVKEGFSNNLYGTAAAYQWDFMDDGNHGFGDDEYSNRNHWKVEVNVSTNSEGPYVDVGLKATPLE